MCRLFALHAGAAPQRSTFWLITAPESLAQQSRQEPDSTGIGIYGPDGWPDVDRQAVAAYRDPLFAEDARVLVSRTFIAHVRYASTGPVTVANTHPFEQDNRLLAHNGVLMGLDVLDARLRELRVQGLVRGETDSERMFALITAEARRNGGDVGGAIAAALTWIAENLPVYAANLLLTTRTDVWALRYPETHELYVLEREPGGHRGDERLEARTDRISARSEALSGVPSILFATSPMDDDPGWRLLGSGELMHVDQASVVTASFPLPPRPTHMLTAADLDERAARSQARSGPAT